MAVRMEDGYKGETHAKNHAEQQKALSSYSTVRRALLAALRAGVRPWLLLHNSVSQGQTAALLNCNTKNSHQICKDHS